MQDTEPDQAHAPTSWAESPHMKLIALNAAAWFATNLAIPGAWAHSNASPADGNAETRCVLQTQFTKGIP